MKMAKLYVFNPEHDLALAANLSNFTSPLAGRKLRHDIGYIPALWAGDDDYILVDDVHQAEEAYSKLRAELGLGPKQFVDKKQLSRLYINKVEPWGWDLALRSFLIRYGIDNVPSEDDISVIRNLSHRRQAAVLLEKLQMEGVVGYSQEAFGLDEIKMLLNTYHHIVVKAPWSSSGRGVRFIEDTIDSYQERWISNVIEKQGSVMVEPYYNKVMDFGMEFESDGKGKVSYLGLSLFHTVNGAYTGNILAAENEKMLELSRYVSSGLVNSLKNKICSCLGDTFCGKYQGPFGVDMMIVAMDDNGDFLLHPCVEINLRRTMGHVALAIPPYTDGCKHVMEITKREDDFKVILSQI
jgi:hypothetical protein